MAYISFQPSDHFSAKLYTGNQPSDVAGTGVGFSPNMVWVKNMDRAKDPLVFDTVRGTGKSVYPSTEDSEVTDAAGIKSFDADGFTVGDWSQPNTAGDPHVSWNWKMGTTSGITQGGASSTPSAYSFNATAKQSIIKFTGTGSVATVPHGLGVKPDCIFIKNLDANEYWSVYHKSIGATAYACYLNATNAKATTSVAWNDTEPTADVFTVGTEAKVNGSGNNMIAYCFASVNGYSKFGEYTGNGQADMGTFVYLGFKPSFFLTRAPDSVSGWYLWSDKMEAENMMSATTEVNSSAANETSREMDFYSNGVKMKENRGSHNDSGTRYIYFAFGTEPLVSSNNIPTTAR